MYRMKPSFTPATNGAGCVTLNNVINISNMFF